MILIGPIKEFGNSNNSRRNEVMNLLETIQWYIREKLLYSDLKQSNLWQTIKVLMIQAFLKAMHRQI